MKKTLALYAFLIVATAAATAGVMALLMSVHERKTEAKTPFFKLVDLDESTVDPAIWGRNFPREYDGYLRTSDTNRTRYGGSEAFSKLDEQPALRRIFNGYAFGVDYREERGHAHSLEDQKLTERTHKFKQPGACLQCHAGGMKQVYEAAGGGSLMAGFEAVCAMPLTQAWTHVQFPIACTDCHDPKTLHLRVTRPGFLNGIAAFAKTDQPCPQLPSIARWREGGRSGNYDPNTMASEQEMRSMVCGQCHVEYYFKGDGKLLTYPWHKGLKMEDAEAYYDEVGHVDWTHAETGAKVLKAQHPEFELWGQGIHARSGVACADCHMPYKREGAMKVSDHHIRSPLLNIERACLTCHHFPAEEMKARVEATQDRTKKLMEQGQLALVALIDDLKAATNSMPQVTLDQARALQRKAQWRLDYVNAENSMGFHAPQESARIIAEAIDLARQGQLALRPAAGGK